MTSTTFDTLSYAKKLQGLGFSPEQAEGFAQLQQEVIRSYDEASRKDLATKGDIQDVRMEIQSVRVEMQAMKHDILRWMVGGFLAQTAVIVAILSFLRP